MAELSKQAAEEATYGIGLLLDDGDIVFEAGTPGTVSGLPNLVQALQLRILTPWGTDPINSAYGLDLRDAFTIGLGRDAMKALVRLNLIRTVSADPRVAELRAVLFDDDPAYFAAHPGATAPANSDQRRHAMVEVDFDPVPVQQTPGATASVTALTGSSPALSLLTDLSW